MDGILHVSAPELFNCTVLGRPPHGVSGGHVGSSEHDLSVEAFVDGTGSCSQANACAVLSGIMAASEDLWRQLVVVHAIVRLWSGTAYRL